MGTVFGKFGKIKEILKSGKASLVEAPTAAEIAKFGSGSTDSGWTAPKIYTAHAPQGPPLATGGLNPGETIEHDEFGSFVYSEMDAAIKVAAKNLADSIDASIVKHLTSSAIGSGKPPEQKTVTFDVLFGVKSLNPKLAIKATVGISINAVDQWKGQHVNAFDEQQPMEPQPIGPFDGTKILTCPNCLSTTMYAKVEPEPCYVCAECEAHVAIAQVNDNPYMRKLLAAAEIVRRRGVSPGALRVVCSRCYRFTTLRSDGQCKALLCVAYLGASGQNAIAHRETVSAVLGKYFNDPRLDGPFVTAAHAKETKIGDTVKIKLPHKFVLNSEDFDGAVSKSIEAVQQFGDALSALADLPAPPEPSRPPARKRRIVLTD